MPDSRTEHRIVIQVAVRVPGGIQHGTLSLTAASSVSFTFRQSQTALLQRGSSDKRR
jgi:hypothetical protein